MSDQRFAARRRQGTRRRILRWGGAVLVVALLAAGAWAVYFSSLLGVRTVEVVGVDRLQPDQVRTVADVPDGRPLARLDLVEIQTRLSRLEAVESVRVERDWPRTVRIEVVERTPVAWTRVDGRIRGLDRYGVDYRTFQRPPEGLVEVSSSASDPRQRPLAIAAAATVVAALREQAPSLTRAVRAVEAPSRDAVTLVLTQGREVTWGSADRTDQKLEVLGALLRIDAAGYDVSAPEQPTTRG